MTVASKLTKVIGRIKFLVWVYSYRVKKTVTNYLTNREILNKLNEINSNIKRIDSKVISLGYADLVISHHYEEKDNLCDELRKLKRKIHRLEKEKKDARPKKRVSISKKRS